MKRLMKTMDGNHAAAHVAYAYTDVAAIYPITPSSVMAETADAWAAEGKQNIFGEIVRISEMQSEAGAAGTVHGSLATGALTTTFTASQGLLLMIPNLYKIAGERLPGVFHVSARTIATHALSIFGDHSDIYACRQTGVAMLCESSVQEVMDLSPVSHCAAVEAKMPFINFFDGFRTSHEIQKISVWQEEDLKDFMDIEAVNEFRAGAMNPEHPYLMGSAQNPDTYFQTREACNEIYDKLPRIVEKYMQKINEKIGTDYKLFNYYGDPQAEHVIIAMGAICETAEEAIDHLASQGTKAGLIKVRLYRPFCRKALLEAIPKNIKKITVLDRTKEPGAGGEPLYLDVIAALKDTKFEAVKVYRGRYGLSSKDTTPGQILAVFANDKKEEFTIGIRDDVTNLSLEECVDPSNIAEGTYSCKFWGLGADGTVGANKNSIKIIGDNTDMYAQAYFDYDSKKSGGVTISHLRFGKNKIRATYLVRKANFVACHNPSYVWKYNMVQDLVPGGTFLLNCPWEPDDVENHLPGQLKSYLAENNITFYIINAVKIGMETGMGSTRVNTILQSAFFQLTKIIPGEDAIRMLKEAAKVTYGRKGEDVVKKNCDAIDAGAKQMVQVPVKDAWKECKVESLFGKKVEDKRCEVAEYVNQIQRAVNAQEGNKLPVSAFKNYANGSLPSGTAAYEKRGVAVSVPIWHPQRCIQCNICSYVCPHGVIRPAVLNKHEVAAAPKGMQMVDMNGLDGCKFAITVSVEDCTGCSVCVKSCPAKGKAITMDNAAEHQHNQTYFDYGRTLSIKEAATDKFRETTVKGSQLRQPLLEFSGACAGCGETPYAKLVTQLYGERLYIANATGCSSIWGNSSPATPYTVNQEGKGPVWSNSLFEDAAEFGYGMLLSQEAIRMSLRRQVEDIADNGKDSKSAAAAKEWLETYCDGQKNTQATEKFVSAITAWGGEKTREILKKKEFLTKKSQWIFGGDGWAYDIGFGGLDHVLASGRDINVLVFDTEVYSNTGGQASKSTPIGAVAQFAAAGKSIKKKDLAAMAMTYGYVYVAQIAMGADYNQCLKAITEAEAYPGPSLVIAYSPCINQGIKAGMSSAMEEQKAAVEAGYWHLFRCNPTAGEGRKPLFTLDSKKPKEDYINFLNGEIRFNSLARMDKEKADMLFERARADAAEKYQMLQEKAEASLKI